MDLAVPRAGSWAEAEAGGERLASPGEPVGDVRVWPLVQRGSEVGRLRLTGPTELAPALAGAAGPAVAAALLLQERAELVDTLRTALLPPQLPPVAGVGLGARYRPAREALLIGGDFYDVWPVGSEHAFVLGDVSGKGVAAAVLTGQVRQSLRTAAELLPDPAQALALVDGVLRAADGRRFATAVHGRFEADGGRVQVRLAGAGHPDPLHLRADGTVERVRAGGTVLGMLRSPRFSTTSLTLAAGESLVLWTDGVTEARARRELLGEQRLVEVVGDSLGLPAHTLAERVEQVAVEHAEGGPRDDLAVLVVQAA